MVSKQVIGIVTFYRITPNGHKIKIYENNLAALGPSGSSEGTIASTPEKWLTLPVINAKDKVLRVNDQLEITGTLVGAETLDASDSQFVIPITFSDGGVGTLVAPDNTTEWDVKACGDLVMIADIEMSLCKKTIRKPFALGGGKIFLSMEDNS